MLENKKRDMTPFDMNQKPIRQNPVFMPVLWLGTSEFCVKGYSSQ